MANTTKKQLATVPASAPNAAALAAAFMSKAPVAAAPLAPNPNIPKGIASRAGFTGTLTFGMVTFGVKVYSATEQIKIAFNQLNKKTGSRVKQQLVDSITGEVVVDVAKGHEITKGTFITVTDEELAACQIASENTMSVSEFVPAEQIDPIYFEKTQYIAPAVGGERAFGLLRAGMVQTGRVAVVTFATRGRQKTAVIRPITLQGGVKGLALHELFYENEVRDFNGWNAVPEPSEAEAEMAAQLINMYAADYDSSKFYDQFDANVRQVVTAKAGNAPVPTFAPVAAPALTNGNDLMSLLTASVAAAKAAKTKTN